MPWFFNKTLSSTNTDIPSIVCVPNVIISSVVATLQDFFTSKPDAIESTYDLFAASFALLGVSVKIMCYHQKLN